MRCIVWLKITSFWDKRHVVSLNLTDVSEVRVACIIRAIRFCRGSKPNRPAIEFVVRQYTDWATTAPSLVFISSQWLLPPYCFPLEGSLFPDPLRLQASSESVTVSLESHTFFGGSVRWLDFGGRSVAVSRAVGGCAVLPAPYQPSAGFAAFLLRFRRRHRRLRRAGRRRGTLTHSVRVIQRPCWASQRPRRRRRDNLKKQNTVTIAPLFYTVTRVFCKLGYCV
jgi:hypothetical protein